MKAIADEFVGIIGVAARSLPISSHAVLKRAGQHSLDKAGLSEFLPQHQIIRLTPHGFRKCSGRLRKITEIE